MITAKLMEKVGLIIIVAGIFCGFFIIASSPDINLFDWIYGIFAASLGLFLGLVLMGLSEIIIKLDKQKSM